jgi:hypothetical protein
MGKKKGGQTKAAGADATEVMGNLEKMPDVDAVEAKEKMEVAKVAAERVAAAKVAEEEAKAAEGKAAAKAVEEVAAKVAEEAATASSKAAAEAVAAAVAAETAAKAAQEEAAAKAAEAAAKAKAADKIAVAAAQSAADQMASAQTPLEAAMKQAAQSSEEGRAAAEISVATAAEEVAAIKKHASSTDLIGMHKSSDAEEPRWQDAVVPEDDSAKKAAEAAVTATAAEAAAEAAAAAARAIWPEYEASDQAVEKMSEQQELVEKVFVKAAEEGMAGKAAATVAVSTAAEEVAGIKAQTIENTTDGSMMIVDRTKAEQLAGLAAAAVKRSNKAAARAEIATTEAMAERLALLATAALKAENMAAADALLAAHAEEQSPKGTGNKASPENQLTAFGVQLAKSPDKASTKGGLAKTTAATANVAATISGGKTPNTLFISHALDVAQTGTRPAVWQPGGKPFVSYADVNIGPPSPCIEVDSSIVADEWDIISHSDVAVALATHAYTDYSLAVEVTKVAIEDAIEKLAVEEEAARRVQSGGSFPYMIVCEHWSIFGGAYYTVSGLESEKAARESAKVTWACLLLLQRQPNGTYAELEEGGYTSTVTFGYVHARIRRWMDEQVASSGGLEAWAVPSEQT